MHSGSRGLGQAILCAHVDRHRAGGLTTGSDDFAEYIRAHDDAMVWASVNREVIAERFLDCLAAPPKRSWISVTTRSPLLRDESHNDLWLHRKGAAPSIDGPVAIPGSRGAITYLVAPKGAQDDNAWSLAHGAGRRWTRSESKARLTKRYRPQDLTRTDLGGRVICGSKDLLFEEAPQAYKDIESVISDLTDAGLIDVIATLRPVITYKTRRT